MVESIDKPQRELSAKEIAKRELAQERQTKAVKLLKSKMKELEDAKVVVKNIERELEDLEAEIEEGIHD